MGLPPRGAGLAPAAARGPAGRKTWGPGHSLVVVVGALALVMVGTIGRPRVLRRRLVCLPIGWFCGLVLSGVFLHDHVFLWPLLGTDAGGVGLLLPSTLLVLGEAAGICAPGGWLDPALFGLNRPGPRRMPAAVGSVDGGRCDCPGPPRRDRGRTGRGSRARSGRPRADRDGPRQAAALAAALAGTGAVRVLSSPLRRARGDRGGDRWESWGSGWRSITGWSRWTTASGTSARSPICRPRIWPAGGATRCSPRRAARASPP